MKISVLFKPSKSGINNILQYAGYYEIKYKDLYKLDLKDFNKIKINGCPQDKIGEVYEYLQKQLNEKSFAIIMVPISELFN